MKSFSFTQEIAHKMFSQEQLLPWIHEHRQKGLICSLVTGVFDLLHVGHVEFLYQAAQQADLLIVAINTDTSVRLYKAANRPLIFWEHRSLLVASLPWVSAVVPLTTRDAIPLIEQLRPEVFVNGSEYNTDYAEAAVVQHYLGRIHVVDRLSAFSTSAIIQKVQVSCV